MERNVLTAIDKINAFAYSADSPSTGDGYTHLLPYTFEVINVYKGCFLDYPKIEELEEIKDWEQFEPEILDDFELLFRFRILFGDKSVSEDFYRTVTTVKKIRKRYTRFFAENPSKKTAFSYKYCALSKFDVLEIKDDISFYFNVSNGETRQGLILQLLNFLDHSNRASFLKDPVDVSHFGSEFLSKIAMEDEWHFKVYGKNRKLIDEWII